MDMDLVEVIIGLVLAAIIWLAVILHRRSQRKAKEASRPPQSVINQHIATIQEMRAANAGYHEQLSYLLQQGLNKELAEDLIIQIERESRS